MIEEVVRQAEYLFDSLMRVQPATTPRWWEQTSQKGTEKGAAAKGSGKGPGKSAGKAKGKGSKRGYDAAFSYPQEAPGIFITGPWMTDPPPLGISRQVQSFMASAASVVCGATWKGTVPRK